MNEHPSTAVWRDNDDLNGSMLVTGSQMIIVFQRPNGEWWVKLGLAFADKLLPGAKCLPDAKVAAVALMREKLLVLLAGLPDAPITS